MSTRLPASTELAQHPDARMPLIEHRIASRSDPGVELYVRQKEVLEPRSRDLAGQAVLFVHGATVASDIFDVAVPGYSWLEDMAQRGARAFALDIRGYGRSSRPASFDRAPTETEPYARAAKAIRDIDDALDFVRETARCDAVHLVGGSWGSVTSGLYAATTGRDKIAKLVLYAPLYSDHNDGWLAMIADPDDPSRPNPALGAYRLVTSDELRQRWDREIPVSPPSEWRPETVFEAMVASSMAADPQATRHSPPAFRVPNGTLLDLFEVFNNRPLYDAKDLVTPVLLIRGANDPTSTHRDASGLYDRLGAAHKWHVTIGSGSHFVTAERNAPQVHAAAASFLSAD